jgi:hypothetical protein
MSFVSRVLLHDLQATSSSAEKTINSLMVPQSSHLYSKIGISISLMRMAASAGVPGARMDHGKLGQFVFMKKGKVILDSVLNRLEHFDTFGVEPRQGSRSDAPYHHGIHLRTADRLYRVACPMNMIDIAIHYG